MNLINFLNSFTSVIAGGGIGIIIVTALSKKIIDMRIKKDLEKFKSDLLISQKLNSERQLFVLNSQLEAVKGIWDLVVELVEICEHFDENKRRELVSINKKLKGAYNLSKPFINESFEKNINDLLDTSDPEKYEINNYNFLIKSRDALVFEYRKIYNFQ